MRTQMIAGLVCLLLVCTSPTALGLGSGPTSDGSQAITAVYAIDRSPGQTGQVTVTATIAVPQHVTGLSVTTPADATVLRADGLESDGSRWHIASDTGTARLTYTVPVGLTTTFGRRTADTGDWALVARQEVALRARWRWHVGPRPTWSESLAVAPGQEGVAGETAAYIGPHTTATRRIGGDRITLVVPASADMRPSRTAVLDSISHAKRASGAGTDHDHVRVFAAPNRLAAGGYTPANGGPDAIVNAGEPVRSPVNVWVHEYHHTRQAYETTPEMAWLEEGSADYQTAVMTYQQGAIDEGQFRARITSDRHSDADLTRPDSWTGPGAQYDKGTRVVAAIDARIRLATAGNASIEAVLARLSERDDRVTLTAFARTVSVVAGEDLSSFVRRAVTGPAPTVPTADIAEDDALRRGAADTGSRQRNAAPIDGPSAADQQSAYATENAGQHRDSARAGTARSGQWGALGALILASVLVVARQRRRAK